MKTPPAVDVDAYIAASTEAAQPVLAELRKLMLATAPGVEETISWGVPFYKLQGQLGGFATYKKHVSFGLSVELPAEDRRLLEEAGYATGKKTVQIGFDQEVPVAAIRRLLTWSVAMRQGVPSDDPD